MSGHARGLSQRVSEGVLLFFCVFLPFRIPLTALLGGWIKWVPAAVILALFFWHLAVRRMRLRFTLADGLFALFLLFALVSTCGVNHLRFYLFLHETRSLALYYLLAMVLREQDFGKETLLRVSRTLQWVSWPLAALGLVERLCSKTVLFDQAFARSIYSFDNLGRVYSTFYNPNIYGLFLVLVFFLSLTTAALFRQKSGTALYAQLSAMLALTMSRSSLIAFGAVLAVYALLLRRELFLRAKVLAPRILLCGAAAAAVALALPRAAEAYYFARVQPMLEGESLREMSLEVREITFTGADGTLYDGWLFNGITYLDARCAVPLREAGAVVHLPEGDVTLPVENDALREAYIYSNAVLKSFHVSSVTRMGALKQARTYQLKVNGRFYSVLSALRVARDHPVFGAGFGSFGSAAATTWTPDLYGEYGLPKGFYSDCQYCSVLGETGFVGLGLFLAFLAAFLLAHRKHILCVTLCLLMGWFGLFFNMLEVQHGALLLWALPAIRQFSTLSLSDLRDKLSEK